MIKSLGIDKNTIGGILEIVKFKNGKEISREKHHNLVMNSSGYGRNVILRHLKGDTTYSLYITEFCAGSSSQAPTITDTNLINLVMSGVPITQYTLSGSNLILNIFVTDGDMPDGTYREFGFKTDEGRLFSRVVVSEGYVKSTGEDTLFIYTINI